MYEMYPEWGPAKNDPDHPMSSVGSASGAVQTSLDLRDHGGPRPDDN